MANTHADAGIWGKQIHRLRKSYETSADNADVTVATPTDRDRVRRLVAVLVKYSGSVTKNVTISYDASHGPGYDATLHTIALSNATTGSYVPEEPLLIGPEDSFVVVAEAGGAGVTAALTVLTEEM